MRCDIVNQRKAKLLDCLWYLPIVSSNLHPEKLIQLFSKMCDDLWPLRLQFLHKTFAHGLFMKCVSNTSLGFQ